MIFKKAFIPAVEMAGLCVCGVCVSKINLLNFSSLMFTTAFAM